MVTAWQPAQHAEKCSASEYFNSFIQITAFLCPFLWFEGFFLCSGNDGLLCPHETLTICECNFFHWLHAFCFQFQKQGKDLEKVKQRLVEIANYVDKVKRPPPLCTGEINHLFKIEIFLAAEINGTSAWYINFLLKQLTLVCLTPLPELCLYSLHAT